MIDFVMDLCLCVSIVLLTLMAIALVITIYRGLFWREK